MKKALSILLFLSLVSLPPLCSQGSDATAWHRQSGITYSLAIGHTIPNSAEWNYISDNYLGVDIAESRTQLWTLAGDSLSALLRRPYQMGLRVNLTCYPNPIAGHKLGLAGFVVEPLLDVGNHHLGLELDAGFAFYSNPFRLSKDAANVFIGSYINCLIQAGLSYSYTIPQVGDIVLAAKFLHSSNGYLVKPNKGLNYLQTELGFRPFRRSRQAADIRLSASDIHGGDWFASYAGGMVMPRFVSKRHKYFYVNTARLGWLYHFNAARAAGLNLDLTYNYSFNELHDINNDPYPLPFFVGLAAAYEASYHRLTLHAALASYLLRSDHGTTLVYERLGLFYNIGDQSRRLRQFVGVSLKSHMAHVDFIEWHYGLKFR